jgi:nitrogen fixation-related uncharacterized protein
VSTHDAANTTARSRSRTSVAWLATVVFGAIVLIPSMAGFVIKFGEMIALANGTGDDSFAVTPVVNYLLASGGFFCLLLWATRNGMFRDLEHPKHAMLEQERRLDAHE